MRDFMDHEDFEATYEGDLHEPLAEGECNCGCGKSKAKRRVISTSAEAFTRTSSPSRRLAQQLPPGRNLWFKHQQAARLAAQNVARRLGQGFSVHHHIYPTLGLRHYHIQAPNGRFVRLRFFYRGNASPVHPMIQRESWDDDDYRVKGKRNKPRRPPQPSNQSQNLQAKAAVQVIQRRIGRRLNEREYRRLHDEITRQGLNYHEIIETGIALFS